MENDPNLDPIHFRSRKPVASSPKVPLRIGEQLRGGGEIQILFTPDLMDSPC